YGDGGGPWACHLVRTTRTRRHVPAPACSGSADIGWVWCMAGCLCWTGFASADLMGVLLDEVEGRARRPGACSRSERTGYRSGVLFAQQSLQARLILVAQSPSRQQISVGRDRRGCDPATAIHLHATLPDTVRNRGDPALGLAVAGSRRGGLLSRRRGGGAAHSPLPPPPRPPRSGRISPLRGPARHTRGPRRSPPPPSPPPRW